jgi:arylsulfatase A-like enzyme
MGDDIGWMQPSIYHRGLMVGETPNIDRIGKEGARFMDYWPSRAARPVATPSSPACTLCGRA